MHALAALEAASIPAEPLLRRAGVSRQAAADIQLRLSAAGQARFFELASEALGDDMFGLRIAMEANPRGIGLLYYVTSSAKNLEEGGALFARYCRIVNESVRVSLTRQPDSVTIEATYVGFARRAAQQIIEFQFAALMKSMREITGRNIRPVAVTHAHPRVNHLKDFEQFYGCPVEFAGLADRVVLSRETAALPLVTEDRYLLQTLRPYADEAAHALGTPAGSLRATVENEIQRLLPHGKAQAATIAGNLALSLRTMSRRLAEEGATFPEILDDLRRSSRRAISRRTRLHARRYRLAARLREHDLLQSRL